jgi:DNA-binding NtrC family response regulator
MDGREDLRETREHPRPDLGAKSGPAPGETSTPEPPRSYFLVFEGSACWVCKLPARGTITVGRSEEAGIRLESSSVSRLHAELAASEAGIWIRDLGSRNGTSVNGEEIRAPKLLQAGDLIELPGARLVYHDAGATRRLSADARAFQARVEGEHERSLRSGRSWSVLVLDAGQPFVGASAIGAASAIERSLRQADVGHWDGERVSTVLLPETDGEGARIVAERLVTALRELAPDARAAVASYPSDGTKAADVLAAARANLARAAAGQVIQAVPSPQQIQIGNVRAVVADPQMRHVLAQVERLAQGEMPVLVTGETGVGKELIAGAVHHWSARKAAPFVTLNCAAMPEQLLESELFGYEKGAFTGAAGTKPGLLVSAHGGTVFLDEIAELPPPGQAKLLRVLDNKRLRPLGEVREREVDVRIVAATNRDLETEVAEGRFRKDLYFRLRGAAVWIPPLRKRSSEIQPLFEAFLQAACARIGRLPVEVPAAVGGELKGYGWPGNVRELRSFADYVAATEGGGGLRPGCLTEWLGRTATQPVLPIEERRESGAATPVCFRPVRDELRELERGRMEQALAATGGNQTRAAELIRMPVRTFMAKVKQYNLLLSQYPRGREE